MNFRTRYSDIIEEIPDQQRDFERFVPAEGDEDASLFIIGEAPGATEVERGRPFVGRGGNILVDALNAAGVTRRSVYITNLVKVRPEDNRDPYRAEIDAWTPLLHAEIQTVSPDVILTLGRIPMNEMIETDARISDIHGERFDEGRYCVLPTFHPAATLYDRSRLDPFRKDITEAVRWSSESDLNK